MLWVHGCVHISTSFIRGSDFRATSCVVTPKCGAEDWYEDEDGHARSILEQNIRLRGVFGTAGRLRSTVAPQGKVLPLYYLYDFGVSLTFCFKCPQESYFQ
jgi:hypothetical protein